MAREPAKVINRRNCSPLCRVGTAHAVPGALPDMKPGGPCPPYELNSGQLAMKSAVGPMITACYCYQKNSLVGWEPPTQSFALLHEVTWAVPTLRIQSPGLAPSHEATWAVPTLRTGNR